MDPLGICAFNLGYVDNDAVFSDPMYTYTEYGFIAFQVAPHPYFSRSGPNILYNATIPLPTALLGGTIRIPTIDGDVDLKVPAGAQPEEKRIMRGRGVTGGDQIVTFKMSIPKRLTETQKKLLK